MNRRKGCTKPESHTARDLFEMKKEAHNGEKPFDIELMTGNKVTVDSIYESIKKTRVKFVGNYEMYEFDMYVDREALIKIKGIENFVNIIKVLNTLNIKYEIDI